MQRERLTPDRIRRFALQPDKAQVFLWDTEAPRLAVRATVGAKSFVFESKLDRRTLRVTIGDVRAWNLDDARAEARRLQTMIDQGIDPRIEKAEQQAKREADREQAKRRDEPAAEAWRVYIKDRSPEWGQRHLLNHEKMSHAGGKPKTRGRKKGASDTTEPGPLHDLLQRPLSEITAKLVKSWLEENNRTRPTYTAQAYRALRAFLNWAASHDDYKTLTHQDACTASETRRKVAKSAAKTDVLQREQLALWFEHVKRIGNPVFAAYLQALLLTGARREELAGLRWDDVDFQWRSARIRDKVEGARTIPLTPYVGSLLAGLPRRNQWVFSSDRSQTGRIADASALHAEAVAAAGVPHVSLHGLRRSFKSLSEWCEVPTGVVAQLMGHRPSATAEKHYTVRPLDLLRMWHTKIEGWILEQAGIEQPEEGTAVLKVVA